MQRSAPIHYTHTYTCSVALFSADQKEMVIQQRLHSHKHNSTSTPFQRLKHPNVHYFLATDVAVAGGCN